MGNLSAAENAKFSLTDSVPINKSSYRANNTVKYVLSINNEQTDKHNDTVWLQNFVA